MISAPGIYEISLGEYHGNCCVGPSLSSSGAREIVESSPLKFWFHSYLNPKRQPEEAQRFDLGTAAHAALLEPHTMMERIGIVEAEDWRTNAAKEKRAEYRAAGKTPLLAHQAAQILEMRDALLAHPVASTLWTAGHAERTYVWRDPLTEVWLKCRPDFSPEALDRLIDYKTTSRADATSFARRVWENGHFVQAAWNLEGVEAVTDRRPREFVLVAQEIEPPYLVSVFVLGPRAIQWGRLVARRAIDTFAHCVAANDWPGYPEAVEPLELPVYAESQLQLRHDAGEFQGSLAAIPALQEISARPAALDEEAWR